MTTRAARRRALTVLEPDQLDTTGCTHSWWSLGPSARHHLGLDPQPAWQCSRCGAVPHTTEVVR